MQVTVKLDLSRYSDNEVAMFLVQGIISREEFEIWRNEREAKFDYLDEVAR